MSNSNFIGYEPNEYEKIVMALFSLVKFHNPASLLDVTPEELKDFAVNLQQDYPIEIMKAAFSDIKVLHANKSLKLGMFLEKCYALKKAQEAEHKPIFKARSDPNDWREELMNTHMHSERCKAAPKYGPGVKDYWMKYIKADLALGITKQLPYDKGVRVR